jgi:hypothetical protein
LDRGATVARSQVRQPDPTQPNAHRYLLGIDHTKLTYRYSARDFRLTDVSDAALHDIIA